MYYSVRPVAYIRNERCEALDDSWDDVVSTVELANDVPSDSLRGLVDFSHVEIVFFADWAEDVPPGPWHRRPRQRTVARRRRLRLAQQGPSEAAITTVAIDELSEGWFSVRGPDGIDGTPVLDIEPVFRWSVPRGELRARGARNSAKSISKVA